MIESKLAEILIKMLISKSVVDKDLAILQL